MSSIRFYAADDDHYGKLIKYMGSWRYNMALIHVAFEFDGGIVELTREGFSYYTLEDELESRPADVILYLQEDIDADKEAMYVRASTLAFTEVRVKARSLLKKCFGVPLAENELLCTDFIQLMMGHEPLHLTAVELLDHYMDYAYSVTVQEPIWEHLQDTQLAQSANQETM